MNSREADRSEPDSQSGRVDSVGSSSSSSSSSSSDGQSSTNQSAFSFDALLDEGKTDDIPIAGVQADQERQILLLMLLAQVCALHDPTPRTFTVHVLELFERGILDRQSIRFLFDLGLVPNSPTSLLLQAPDADENRLMLGAGRRSLEATAIRNNLESADDRDTLPWSVASHPLSLSRFQREFVRVRSLAAGAFGEVFQATNKMDGCDYAIKRVAFDAEGFSQASVQQVLREVQCLAACDHPNVVRYFTSWLEPSWMTGPNGQEKSSIGKVSNHKKLLLGLKKLVGGDDSQRAADELRDYFKHPSLSDKRRRSVSLSNSFDASDSALSLENAEYSAWDTAHADDSCLDFRNQAALTTTVQHRPNSPKRRQDPRYSYQICLFMQMQLCHPTTLGDWIEKRNLCQEEMSSRIGSSMRIFQQIASGLNHIHKQGIIHRDLKPANVFASANVGDDDIQFQIGDFGLSKLIERSVQRQDTNTATSREHLTVGVGTASYASPEQVASKHYDCAADVFSLGLILLEMLCCFSTEHERLQTFHDCRHRRVLPSELDNYPLARQVILSCTHEVPSKRPCVSDLVEVDITQPTSQEPALKDDVSALRAQLAECRAAMAKKDETIEALKAEIDRLRGNSN